MWSSPTRYTYLDMGEKDQDNPLPWDEIQAASYTLWDSSIDYELMIERSRDRMQKSPQMKLIDENAKWIKKVQSKGLYSLSYKDYSSELEQNETESKRFDALSDYESNLSFESLPYELPIMEKDSVFKKNRERWHETLKKDVSVEEALNVLSDLTMKSLGNGLSALKD